MSDIPKIIVGICPEDNPRDVDETYGPGTYARLFPSDEDEEPPDPEDEQPELCRCGEPRTYVCTHGECKSCGNCTDCYISDRHWEQML
jgi:hypothetical protein